nr:MAG TPA: hypothetical protein [Caudoviricetes sp.]
MTHRRWRCSSPGLARIVLVVSSQSASAPAGRQASMMRMPSWLACVSGSYGIWFMKFSELVGSRVRYPFLRVHWLSLCGPVTVVGDDLICRVCGEGVIILRCRFSTGKNLRRQLSIRKRRKLCLCSFLLAGGFRAGANIGWVNRQCPTNLFEFVCIQRRRILIKGN